MARERGISLTLPRSKGERTRQGSHRGAAVWYHQPVSGAGAAALAGRRPGSAKGHCSADCICHRPGARVGPGVRPGLVVGLEALDPGSIARILKRRAAAAGFDPELVSGHSLKRGALSTGMERGVHPTRLKQLGRHRSYAVLDTYLELGDPFEGHPLNGVI